MGDALIERLKRLTPSGASSVITSRVLVNPDGPEAASRIAELEAKLATVAGALASFAKVAESVSWSINTCLLDDEISKAKSLLASIQERT